MVFPCESDFWRANLVRRFFCLSILLGGIARPVLGQDPTKVAPTHYKLNFENEYVQVLSVHYGPHEKSEMHDHPGGVVVIINGGHLRFTDQNGKVTEVYSKAGETRWFPPFKHKVENLGDEPYNAVYVGIVRHSADGSDPRDLSPAAAEQLARIIAQSQAEASKP